MYAGDESSYQDSWRGPRTPDAFDVNRLEDGISLTDSSWWEPGKWYVVGDGAFRKTAGGRLELSTASAVDYKPDFSGFELVPVKEASRPAIYPVYLAIKNPSYLDYQQGSRLAGPGNTRGAQNRELVNRLQAEGFDGVITDSDWGVAKNYIPFSPEQIKSAIGNRGAFRPDEGRIDFSQREDLPPLNAWSRLAYQGYDRAEVPRVQAARRISTVIERFDAGEISANEFEREVRRLADRMVNASAAKAVNRNRLERERGPDIVREKLLAARRRGEVDPDTTEFALWALNQNPALADGLAITVRSAPDGAASAAGDYNPASRVMRVFKGRDNPTTAVHEILHHAERMMPPEVQQGIAKEWSRAYTQALSDAATGSAERAALEQFLPALAGSGPARLAVQRAFGDGTLNPNQHYQLTNPSEFWAVNATGIMARRFDVDGWVANARRWLGEMVEKLKGLVGMRSNAPILRGLEAVLRGDGVFQSQRMLSEADRLGDVADPYARFDGIVVEQPILIEETGQQATLRLDAGQTLRTLNERAQTMRRVIDCLRRPSRIS